ncbi:MAG TPA: tetratricopeptide repeat protein [Phycisphaerae bacterium]|jgi:Tfp pilus assembly protein PilF|nr:tetratricopeptide repeat protein [Phycisphaerae bacterium]HOJ54786.1 tetratricopeptide repeat protein [Phycisphaerae bacterium]HOL25862.1 tetratricopeptide repeat protein [Phycisphaerae bacterium]HPP21206.1 tetratricopeptide repeat protein [Phycisphaerae bacterium]HPU31984.1 tetratricopeptide repeat protein [Phycisphaerae bacterium]
MKRYLYLCWATAVVLALRPAFAQLSPPSEGATASAPAVSQPAAETVPDQVREAIADRRYREAIQILEPLAASESAGFDVVLHLAGAYDALALEIAGDKNPELRKTYRQYRDKAVEGYLRAGTLALEAEDPRAQSILERVLRYDPRNVRALAALAPLVAKTSATQAIHYYQEYINTPEGRADLESQIAYGQLLVGEGYWRQAIEVLQKALAAGGGAAAERQLARAYLAGQQPEKALEAVNRALNRDPNDPESYLARASLVLNTDAAGQVDLAVNDISRGVELVRDTVAQAPEDEKQWRRLQLVLANGTRLVEVISAQAVTRPLDSAARVKLAQIVSALGELSRHLHEYQAVRLLSEGAKAADASLDLLVALAQRQRELGQAGAALETAERILKQDPNNAAARLIKDAGGRRESK